MTDLGLGFDGAVEPGGYRWWYLDALSDDGRFGLTLIAFIGSVFSPYYAWRGHDNPLDHVAINVALYAPGQKRWAMTERGHRRWSRDTTHLAIGPSLLAWDGDALTVQVAEVAAPLPFPVRGTVRLWPQAQVTRSFALDPAGRHVWQPLAPRARLEVDFTHPALRWSGTGYLDTNVGTEPLAAGFADWDWSRAHRARDTIVLYDGVRRDGSAFSLALGIGDDGCVGDVAAPPRFRLPTSAWRMARGTRVDAGDVARVARTWEDSPFYVRSTLATHLLGEACTAVHESLSLDRFRMPVVQAMLPFRMPRRS